MESNPEATPQAIKFTHLILVVCDAHIRPLVALGVLACQQHDDGRRQGEEEQEARRQHTS